MPANNSHSIASALAIAVGGDDSISQACVVAICSVPHLLGFGVGLLPRFKQQGLLIAIYHRKEFAASSGVGNFDNKHLVLSLGVDWIS